MPMGNELSQIPELRGLNCPEGLIRIPHELDVPVTPRVSRLIDTSAFQRLAKITQLGLVSLVYPGAKHSRFEHSLGVYRTSLSYLQRLSGDARFLKTVSTEEAESFLVSGLLHDLGHWPFCHLLEDLQHPRIPKHEFLAKELLEGEIADLLQKDWGLDASQIVNVLECAGQSKSSQVISSLLSGPIDIDKMDYLSRDSLHAGVPYGQNFDRARLISSLCLNEAGDALAITEKGRTAAEMMVFARYVMYSEVYWHHAVRSATAMLQCAFSELIDRLDLSKLYQLDELSFIQQMMQTAKGTAVEGLLAGLFGQRRKLYKRLDQFSLFQQPEFYQRLNGRPHSWLRNCARELADLLSASLNCTVPATHILIDAPPAKREVEINMDVFYRKENCYRTLSEVSPVVRALANEQFDDYVKRVRVFVEPDLANQIRAVPDLPGLMHRAIDLAEQPQG